MEIRRKYFTSMILCFPISNDEKGLFKKMDRHELTNTITKVLFFIYLVALFEIIVFKMDFPFRNMGHVQSVNLIPFKESLITNGQINYAEIFMNFVIFIPLGIYIEMLCDKWPVSRKIFIIFATSLLCEVLQFLMAVGVSDITDIINNTLGGIVGIFFMKVLVLRAKNQETVHTTMNILASIGTTCMILLFSAIIITDLFFF